MTGAVTALPAVAVLSPAAVDQRFLTIRNRPCFCRCRPDADQGACGCKPVAPRFCLCASGPYSAARICLSPGCGLHCPALPAIRPQAPAGSRITVPHRQWGLPLRRGGRGAGRRLCQAPVTPVWRCLRLPSCGAGRREVLPEGWTARPSGIVETGNTPRPFKSRAGHRPGPDLPASRDRFRRLGS